LASLIIPMAETRFLALLKLTECYVGLKAAKKVLVQAQFTVDQAKHLLSDAIRELATATAAVSQIMLLSPLVNQAQLDSAQAEVKTRKGALAKYTRNMKIKQQAVTSQTAALAEAWLGKH